MAGRGFRNIGRYFLAVFGFMSLALVGLWASKIYRMGKIKAEIVRLEKELDRGQAVWREHPPLTPAKMRELRKTQERLFYMLPREKDIPSLLQEISRLAREYSLTDVSFTTGNGATPPGPGQAPSPPAATPQAVVQQPPSAVAPAEPPSSGPIDSFLLKMTFSGDYRELAYFLEALERLPRLVTIQSLVVRRDVPLVAAELQLQAYYQKGELPGITR